MKGFLRALSFALGCVMMLGGGGAAYGLAPSASSGTLVFGLSSEPPNLDPQINNGTAARTVKLQIYRGLFSVNASGRPEKELIASFDRPNPTTYIFHLRPNLKFSDTSALTADDVVFTFERIADPKVGAYLKKRLSIIQSAVAVDPATVKVTLAEPNAAFLDILAIPEAVIVSKRFTLAHDGNLKNEGMGAGPYVLRQWQHGVQITVDRNPLYYRPRTPPWGLAGGAPGRGARFYHVRGHVRDRLGSKVRVRLHEGDRLVIETSGGGGWGPPVERDPSRVAADVAEGFVSRARASEAYGVVLEHDGTVDLEATRKARERLGR